MYQEEGDYRTLSGRHPSEIQGIGMKIADRYNVHQTLSRLQLDIAELRGVKDRRDLEKYEYNFELEKRVLQDAHKQEQ